MASSENSDDGGNHAFQSFPVFGGSGSASTSNEYMQLDYLKERRELVLQLKHVTMEKARLDRDLNHMKKEIENGKLREMNTYREYNQLKQKYDNLFVRYNELISDPTRCIKLVEDLTMERNKLQALLKESENEVTTVLSERGTVLKENQKLYDKNETLKKEVDKLTRSRDEALKEVASVRDKLDLMRSRSEFNKDLSESKDKFGLVTDLETATQEIERLKKALDKAKDEVTKLVKETDTAKDRRDWAISEREKIVQERDSIRKQCDEMRKERDTATSKLLAAYRDKDEAIKKIEQLSERNEQLTNDGSLWGYPLIGIEPYQQFDTETVEVDIARIPSNADMGLILEGGDDLPEENGNNLSSFVSVAAVEPDSIFAGKLKVNDYICSINNMDCNALSKRHILQAIRNSAPRCTLQIKRKKILTKRVFTVKLNLDLNRNHGLEFETGLYISKIEANSLAAKETKLLAGDRVLSINNKGADSFKDLTQIYQCINESRTNILSMICVKDVQEKHTNTRPSLQEKGRLYNRMVNSCTQTESGISSGGNNVMPSANPNRISLDFSNNNNHFLPATMSQLSGSSTSSTPMTPSSSKSASKLVSGMIQKIRDKIHMNTGAKHDQENDALAYFDSVLESDQESNKSPPTKDSITKRLRRKNKDSIEKHVGTWPRVSANPISHENHSGTIVHPRKKEKVRPKLYHIFSDTPESSENFFCPQPLPPPVAKQAQSQLVSKLNRNSNPIPADLNRRILERYPELADNTGTATIKPNYRSILYEQPRQNIPNKNRYSLNLQLQGQNSLDFIPIKNTIDLPSSQSISKSPINYTIKTPTRDPLDYYMSNMSKNLSKFASDNESIPEYPPGNTSTLPSQLRKPSSAQSSRIQNHLFNYPPVYSTHQSHHLQQTYNKRYPSPSTVIPPGSDIIGLPICDTISHHSQGSSIDYSYRYSKIQTSKEEVPSSSYLYEVGTFPRKKENPRIRIPSNQSMTSKGSGVKLSDGSIDCSSERASPMPTFHVQVIETGMNTMMSNKRNSMPVYSYRNPYIGMLRSVQIEKIDSGDRLGITIRQAPEGGVFVSSVTEGSLANQIGLQIGDQLLDICGLNLRKANYEFAATVLRKCGNSMTMKVQYVPDKYKALFGRAADEEELSRSGSPTPQNSPQMTRSIMSTDSLQQQTFDLPPPLARHIVSQRSIRSSQHSQRSKDFSDSLEHSIQSNQSSPNGVYKEQPRVLFMETGNRERDLGISLLGGNAYGIFVHSVKKESIAEKSGLRVGDQILEYNGTDLRQATAETAAFELAKPADKVTVLVQYNPQKCNQIKDKPGDSLYIRVGFDRNNSDLGESELAFNKDDVLYVDNTMFRHPGLWRAWKLDEYGHRLQCGVIPSQMKVEEELRLLGDTADGASTTRRDSTSARRSFFKRIKPHRSSSRDSKELASFSNTHLSLYLDSGGLNELDSLCSYQRVERLEYKYRPVLVLGPLAECVMDKLTLDFPEQFKRCMINQVHSTKEAMEQGLQNNAFIEYRKRGSIYECTTVQAIREAKNYHCILDIHVSAVERLHRNQVHPIVLLIKFKSAKQIKELKDARYATDKISGKAVKEMYEFSTKLESDYRQYISAVIPAGVVNITHISTQIKAAVDAEQKKILWVPTNN